MASLIESLVAGSLLRADSKRLAVARRPAPKRLREVLEVFGAMGTTASFQGLGRAIDLRDASPQILSNAVLGRWPTNAELAEQAEGYTGSRHVKRMLVSEEFRGSFIRRAFEAFAEKQRLLHIRIPSCAGQHVAALLQHACSVVPTDIASQRYASPEAMGPLLGQIFNNINNVRGFALSLPRLAPFIDPPASRQEGSDPLGGPMPQTAFRAVDLLFAIIRPPEALALSQVNGTLTVLRDKPDLNTLQPIAASLGRLPPAGRASEWKDLARKLLTDHLPRNPICHALGDGTAAGALAACARVPIELVSLDTYLEWSRPAIDPKPIEPIGVSVPFLEPADLTGQERDIIAERMAEDIAFYARYTARKAANGLPLVRGPELLQD
jgi:hypothetical protein